LACALSANLAPARPHARPGLFLALEIVSWGTCKPRLTIAVLSVGLPLRGGCPPLMEGGPHPAPPSRFLCQPQERVAAIEMTFEPEQNLPNRASEHAASRASGHVDRRLSSRSYTCAQARLRGHRRDAPCKFAARNKGHGTMAPRSFYDHGGSGASSFLWVLLAGLCF